MDPLLSGAFSTSPNDATTADSNSSINNLTGSSFVPSTNPTTSSTPPAASTITTATLPSIPATLTRDCKDLISLLNSMNLAYHPSILPLLLDHYQQLTAALCTHLHTTTQHTHQHTLDTTDTATLITSFTNTHSTLAPTLPPPVELMLPLAVHRNAVPLPLLRLTREAGEVMLPPDRFLLTQRGWSVDVREERAKGGKGGGAGGRESDVAMSVDVNGHGSTVP